MEFPPRQVFGSEDEWLAAHIRQQKVSSVVRALARHSEPLTESYSNFAHFVAGSLLRDGFRLFKNGGTPLLERHVGDWVEEIVFHAGAWGVRGVYAPVSLRIHLSHSKMKEVRAKYWAPPSAAPRIVACGDAGQIEASGRWILWNACCAPEAAEDAARTLERSVLPWFERFHEPFHPARQLALSRAALVDAETALELSLARAGVQGGRSFLAAIGSVDGALHHRILTRVDQITTAAVSGGRGTSPIHNVAVIAASYGLADKAGS